MPILQISQGKLPVSLEWAYMTKGAPMAAYAYFVLTLAIVFWLILILAKTNEILGEIRDGISELNKQIDSLVKGKV